ncbi:hypothetical protein NW752_011577, partial [Fusarium irregulare]
EVERSLAQGRGQSLEEMVIERTTSNLRIGAEVTLDEWYSELAQHSPLSDYRAARRRGINSFRGSISTFVDEDSEEENAMRLSLDESQIPLDMFLTSDISRNLLGTG